MFCDENIRYHRMCNVRVVATPADGPEQKLVSRLLARDLPHVAVQTKLITGLDGVIEAGVWQMVESINACFQWIRETSKKAEFGALIRLLRAADALEARIRPLMQDIDDSIQYIRRFVHARKASKEEKASMVQRAEEILTRVENVLKTELLHFDENVKESLKEACERGTQPLKEITRKFEELAQQ